MNIMTQQDLEIDVVVFGLRYIFAFNVVYMYYIYVIFFSRTKSAKFTISDFRKQTHFGHILITFFFFTL